MLHFTGSAYRYSTLYYCSSEELPTDVPAHCNAKIATSTHHPIIGPIDEIKCDSSGCMYVNTKYDISLHIPVGAIPKGMVIIMKVGILSNLQARQSPFGFPEGRKPISPVVWLCADPDISFLKPFEVTLPHYLDCTNEEQCNKLRFLKAHHDRTVDGHYQFEPANGEAIFKPHISYGILSTTHCCFLCIQNEKFTEQNRPSPIFALSTFTCCTGEHSWKVYLCVTYLLDNCIEVRLNINFHE